MGRRSEKKHREPLPWTIWGPPGPQRPILGFLARPYPTPCLWKVLTPQLCLDDFAGPGLQVFAFPRYSARKLTLQSTNGKRSHSFAPFRQASDTRKCRCFFNARKIELVSRTCPETSVKLKPPASTEKIAGTCLVSCGAHLSLYIQPLQRLAAGFRVNKGAGPTPRASNCLDVQNPKDS